MSAPAVDPKARAAKAFGWLRALTALICAYVLHEAILNMVFSKSVDAIAWACGAIVALGLLRPRISWLTAAMVFVSLIHSLFVPLDLGHFDDEGTMPDYHSPQRARQMEAAVWIPTLAMAGVWILRISFGEGQQQGENIRRAAEKIRSRRGVSGAAPDRLLRPAQCKESNDRLLKPAAGDGCVPTETLLRPEADRDLGAA